MCNVSLSCRTRYMLLPVCPAIPDGHGSVGPEGVADNQ